MKIVSRKRTSDFLDDVFDNVFRSPLSVFSDKIVKMQTDIREKDNNYILDIDLAGFNKEDISISIEDGYMTINAEYNQLDEVEEEKYIRKERHIKTCSRSFYVGDVSQDQIQASYENGILTITIPKEEEPINTKKYISID